MYTLSKLVYNIVLLGITIFIIYQFFFSYDMEMKERFRLSNTQIVEYEKLAYQDNNKTAIEALKLHYMFVKFDENKTCYWANKLEDNRIKCSLDKKP